MNRITLEFEDGELTDALTRLLCAALNASSLPAPSATAQAEATQAVSEGLGWPLRPTGKGGLEIGGSDMAVGGGPVLHPPDTRAAINAAAAAGKEELARLRAAKATAPAEEPAKRKRGRPSIAAAAARVESPPGTDLSGDAEEGDTVLDPDSDLTATAGVVEAQAPPANQAVRERTPAEKRDVLVEVLKLVYPKAEVEVLKEVEHFGCKIPLVPDDRVDELWDRTEKLCRKFGVPFVDETPS